MRQAISPRLAIRIFWNTCPAVAPSSLESSDVSDREAPAVRFALVISELEGLETWVAASNQRFDKCVAVRVDEQRDRIPVLAAAVDHPVRRRGEMAIRPDLHDVSEVDHVSVRDRRRPHPLATLALDLEAAVVVLPKDGEASGIRVRHHADLVLALRLILRRIVVELETRHRRAEDRLEEIRL